MSTSETLPIAGWALMSAKTAWMSMPQPSQGSTRYKNDSEGDRPALASVVRAFRLGRGL
jgi:hypothetical protein